MKLQKINIVANGGMWRVSYHVSDMIIIVILVDRSHAVTKAEALEIAADLFHETF